VATRRSTRVTQVNPWIAGGEGQLRDLFPLPPWLFLLGRFIATSFRHFLITITILLAFYLWIAWDWNYLAAFFLFPLLVFLARSTLITLYLWYKNPTIPLIARKP
jgi:hypothetical protein